MRKHLRLIALVIPMVLVASNSYAAVKAGSACSKAGIKSVSAGKTYTCVKSGKKLVWNKGVLIPVAKPALNDAGATKNQEIPATKTELTAFESWNSGATAQEVNDAAQAKFRAWAAQQTNLNPNHRLILETGLASSRASNFTAADKLGARLFGQYFPDKYSTIIGSNQDWVVKQLNASGGSYKDCSNNSGNNGLDYCHDAGYTQGYVISSDMSFQPANPGSDGTALLAHEYFHAVQNRMSAMVGKMTIKEGQDFSKPLFPAWLQEGSANFVGFSVAALAMDTTYWAGRKMMLNYAPPEPSINRNLLKDYEIRSGAGNSSPTYPYITGQLASEFIVASVGFQKFLDIWINFQKTQDFGESFQKSVGISLEDFYQKFELARKNLGLPEVSWKLICLTNYPINEIPNKLPPCRLNAPNSGSPAGQDSTSNSLDKLPNSPPAVDRTSNVEGQGCRQGDEAIKNSFGSFVCTTREDGNNLWKKT
jgi:hypothetical protein